MITVLFVRHADIDVPSPIGNLDPPLNTKGIVRAHELARVAKAAGVTAIFTSNLKRTMETAAPIAAMLGLATPPAVVPDVEAFAAGVLAEQFGPVVLVVGHSNTIPVLIDALVSSPLHVAVQEFDNLFVVSLAAGQSQLIHLKYGAPD